LPRDAPACLQATGERNYHVFYQLLAGGEVYPELKSRLTLKEADEYHYLNQSSVTTVDNINDEKDYEELINAMDVLNMSPSERDNILRLVSAILHLGACRLPPRGLSAGCLMCGVADWCLQATLSLR
jgi:myosin heavy subunit